MPRPAASLAPGPPSRPSSRRPAWARLPGGARAAALALLPLIACALPPDPPGPSDGRVVAIYDPARGVAPLPNDLAFDPATGVIAIPIPTDATPATRAFLESMNGIAGFSSGFPAVIRFSGALDPTTVRPDTVLVLDRTDPSRALDVVRALDPGRRVLTILPRTRWPRGHRIAVVLRGGAGGLRAASGGPVIGDDLFVFLRGPEPLVDSHGRVKSIDLARRLPTPSDGARLEATRAANDEVLRELEATGLPRQDVATLWTFTVADATWAVYDPVAGELPFGNDLALDPATGRVALPVAADADPLTREILEGLNTLTGFSTWAPIRAPIDGPLDPATLDDGLVVLDATTGERVPVAAAWDAALGRISLRPRAPLEPARTYVLALTDALRDPAGRPVRPDPVGALLRAGAPLVDANGRSQIQGLPDAEARRAEPARKRLDAGRDALAARGLPPERLAALWSLTTQPTTRRLEEVRDELRAQLAADPAADDVDAVAETLVEAHANRRLPPALQSAAIATVVTGTYASPSYLDPATGMFGDAPVPVRVPFVATFPLQVRDARIVLLAHPLTGWRHHMFFVADELARQGIATLAIDAPLHGDRAVCQADADCAGGRGCGADGTCANGFAPTTDGDPTGRPRISGRGYFAASPLRTRDHVRQTVVDLLQAVLVARARGPGSLSALVAPRVLDWDAERPGPVQLVGSSLGGIVGPLLLAVEPEIGEAVLSTAGASWIEMLLASPVVGPVLLEELARQGLEPGTAAFERALQVATWALDPAEPLSYARHVLLAPLGTPPPAPRAVFLQKAGGDVIVLAPYSDLLADALAPVGGSAGLLIKTYPGACHAFIAPPTDPGCPGSPGGPAEGRADVARFLLGAHEEISGMVERR